MRIGGIGLVGAECGCSRIEPCEASCHGTHPQGAVMVDVRRHHAIVRQAVWVVRLVVVMAPGARAAVDRPQSPPEGPHPPPPLPPPPASHTSPPPTLPPHLMT